MPLFFAGWYDSDMQTAKNSLFLLTELEYVYVAAAHSIRRAHRPLVIVLHGQRDSLVPFLALPEEMRLHEVDYLYLNAPFRQGSQYEWFNDEPDHLAGIERSRRELVMLLEELIDHGFSSQRIFLFGLSQGGLIAFQTALSFHLPLGGVLGISTYVHFSRKWKQLLRPFHKRMPLLMTHGFSDQEIPLAEALADCRRLQKEGLRVEWFEFDKGHEVETEFEAPFLGQWIRWQLVKPPRPLRRSNAES